MQVPHAQAIELQEVLADQEPAVIQGCQPQLVTANLDRDLQQRRPTPQHRAAQPQQQSAAIHCQAFDVEAVVFARNGHVRTQVGVVGQGPGEQVVVRITFQTQRLSAILGFAHQAGFPVGISFNGQTSQQPPIAIQ